MDLDPKDAELVVGIVARIGVDTRAIVSSVTQELERYGYIVSEIHVTELLKAFSSILRLIEKPLEERYSSYIDVCNKLRSDTASEVMADLAIMDIVSRRGASAGAENVQRRNAFIVNQIKRPEEFERLRKVYGEHYVQVSCHADETVRIGRLISRIAHDHPEAPKNSLWDIKARELVHADESQENEEYGQRVRQVFPLSDVIVDANSGESAEKGIERFFRALFGDKAVTPTREEYGMELANTAAQRSSDLSRQVGAAILTPTMEVQALGCNEVPKAKGGTYWEGDKPDSRDFALGHDSNEQRRRAVLLDLMLRLSKVQALRDDLADPTQIEHFLFERDDKIIADSQLMDSLEYGRGVHAEMNAITDAARGGHAVKNCLLFSNTFHVIIVLSILSLPVYQRSYTFTRIQRATLRSYLPTQSS